jgi:hypothetical protein
MFLCYLEVRQEEKCVKTLCELQESFKDLRFQRIHMQAQHNSKRLGIIAQKKMIHL